MNSTMNSTMNSSMNAPHTKVHNTSSIVLTSRGRVVLGLILTLLAIFVWVLFGSGTADAAGSSQGPATSVVVVQPGENLWSIAQSVDPDSDPRDLLIRIREMNALGSQHVFPGQSLIVPVS
jgi:LysM repeat protein